MFRIVKGDTVQVISGSEKGNRGKVIELTKDKNKVKVQGLNMVKRHVKPSQSNPEGGIIEKEAFLHISNVMIVDPKSDKPTRIGAGYDKDGKKVRVAQVSKEQLD
ncbi:50S ribosomal protein L24 [Chitinivibrio alkaliphilus]|uniref:Large ribosomal subunit protein uL24 n=1 Tax=Chitinivibrio alkaliphilus ACht1 TaxID=1313304 RepID=U7DA38_9BACT|nr:50S ribosomal protein L24 [Chitinivibrio alkaliphilus]ERP31300.1 50S ribosomal protein L24 [Chitinivibrio alkaliphilus ACht1]